MLSAVALAVIASLYGPGVDNGCQDWCKARIPVRAQPVEWQSPDIPADVVVDIDVFVKGKRIRSHDPDGCRLLFYGRGVVAELSACAKGTSPLIVRTLLFRGKPKHITLRYRITSD